ncbi:hypothetical protein DFP72DRAFT_840213 [Ephemerocybe angulata]|uniref:CENP-V/GFA domain-containing protein n=1 Tax=Ephemerocybe angulata TaxID=980116 RepID=A0A8H6IEH4_9AGAR|nr:hypothetical protein DFP72DRAFT_840213 [Tulosesus angulatus]
MALNMASNPGGFRGGDKVPVVIFSPLQRPLRPISRTSNIQSTAIVTQGDLTYCRATCHCRRCDLRVVFPTASLPIHNYLCNCTSCRHGTGEMAFHTARILGNPMDAETDGPFAVEVMDSYSPRDRLGVERFFCPTCSANMLVRIDLSLREEADKRGGEPEDCAFGRNRSEKRSEQELEEGFQWRVAGGALRNYEGIIQPMYHLNLASTMDGGVADHLRVGSKVLPFEWRSPTLTDDQPEEISAFCHCRAVSVKVSRPDDRAKNLRSPFPDLIYPTDVTYRAKLRNPGDEKWWLRGGFDFQSGTFIPRFNIREADQEPGRTIVFSQQESRPKGLKQYVSSPGRYHEFCGTCGATAFWWHVSRPNLVDLSMGLLDASVDGVRAEHWFEWHKSRVSNMEVSGNRKMVASLVEGLRQV